LNAKHPDCFFNNSRGAETFSDYKIALEETFPKHLDTKELNALMTTPPNSHNRELVRDLFIFCSPTGISFVDTKNLTTDI
jgi:hypothetical protein